ISFPEYNDYRSAAGAFADMAAWTGVLGGITVNGRTDRVIATAISGNYFSMLGVQPALGRLISPVDGEFGGTEPIVVLGHSYWVHQVAKDTSIVGKQIKLGGTSFTVIGIVPESFHGTSSFAESDAYIPLEASEARLYAANRDVAPIRIIGRLKFGV